MAANITQDHRFHHLVDSRWDNITVLLHLRHLPHLKLTTVTCKDAQVDMVPALITAAIHHTRETIIAIMGIQRSPSSLNEHQFDHTMGRQSPPLRRHQYTLHQEQGIKGIVTAKKRLLPDMPRQWNQDMSVFIKPSLKSKHQQQYP